MGKEYSWEQLQEYLAVLRQQGKRRPGRADLFVSEAETILVCGTPLKIDEVTRVLQVMAERGMIDGRHPWEEICIRASADPQDVGKAISALIARMDALEAEVRKLRASSSAPDRGESVLAIAELHKELDALRKQIEASAQHAPIEELRAMLKRGAEIDERLEREWKRELNELRETLRTLSETTGALQKTVAEMHTETETVKRAVGLKLVVDNTRADVIKKPSPLSPLPSPSVSENTQMRDVNRILEATASHFGFSAPIIKSGSKKQMHVQARRVAIFLINDLVFQNRHGSYRTIAEILDLSYWVVHSSVCDMREWLMGEYANEWQEIFRKIKERMLSQGAAKTG